ncbi:MAG: hypothetical protein K8L99_14260 [Anaerolineae bacterium]|nr:hypothetical protein [Anaerolineae bacterium]
MNTSTSKIVIFGLPLIVTLISGVILSNSGKPLNSAIFTVHKLIAVGTVILIGANVYKLFKAVDIQIAYLATFGTTGLFFVALIISGALLSLVDGELLNLGETTLQAVLRIHQIVPLLALAASALSIYLLVSSES